MPTISPEAPAVWLSTHERIRNAAVGVIVAAIAVPMIIAAWAPRWFALGWLAAYLAVSVSFMAAVALRPSPRVEQWWSTSIAVLFSAQLVSSVVWSEHMHHFWAAVVLALAFLTFEIAALPFIDIHEWRLGFLVIAATMVGVGLTRLNPIVALSFAPLTWSFIDGVSRVRSLKAATEHQLGRVNRMVHHDDLTGLLNRRGLRAALADNVPCSVVMLDADRFKQINDTYGYAVGDQVLQEIGRELQRRLPASCAIGRQGGDEFVAIVEAGFELQPELFAPVRCAVAWFGQPLELNIAISAGITHSGGGSSADRLLRETGFALREAKRSPARVAVFDGELRERFEQSLEIAALTTADPGDETDRGELVPVGQVIVINEQIVGVEILIRWRRADGTVLGPEEFLPTAVQNGTMPSINEMMIEHAVRFASRFNNLPAAPFVSVNVTATHLTSPGFGERLVAMLHRHRVDSSRLMIEITESEYVGHGRGWESSAAELRQAGIKLAIDDFGSGYSSIERLHRLPITHIKFDRSMVQSASGPFGEIARGVSRFADASQIAIIAEGVETFDELESMRALGVRLFQGFLFGAPDDLDELERLVIASRQPTASRRSNQD